MRPIREGQRVVRGAQLREERDRALEMLRPPPRAALRRRNAPETELHGRLARGVRQRREQLLALSRSPASSSASASFTRAGR